MKIRNFLAERRSQMIDIEKDFLGIDVEIPPIPLLTRDQFQALRRFEFELFFLPKLKLPGDYRGWNFPLEWCYWDTTGYTLFGKYVEKTELPGCWVAVETIAKPDWNKDYSEDNLMSAVGVKSRFGYPIEKITNDILPAVTGKMGFEMHQVQLPYLIEWNFISNLFLYLRRGGYDYPNLGNTYSQEYCLNVIHSSEKQYFAHTAIGLCLGEEEDNVLGRIETVLGPEKLAQTTVGRLIGLDIDDAKRQLLSPYKITGFRTIITL